MLPGLVMWTLSMFYWQKRQLLTAKMMRLGGYYVYVGSCVGVVGCFVVMFGSLLIHNNFYSHFSPPPFFFFFFFFF